MFEWCIRQSVCAIACTLEALLAATGVAAQWCPTVVGGQLFMDPVQLVMDSGLLTEVS